MGGMFVAMVSDLGGLQKEICLESEKTGHFRVVDLFDVEYDKDGDVMFWTYRPRRQDPSKPWALRVYND